MICNEISSMKILALLLDNVSYLFQLMSQHFFFFGQASLHAIFINASGELMKGLSNLRNGNRFQNNVYLRDASSYCFS